MRKFFNITVLCIIVAVLSLAAMAFTGFQYYKLSGQYKELNTQPVFASSEEKEYWNNDYEINSELTGELNIEHFDYAFDAHSKYKSKEGFEIVSLSSKWEEDDLESLYNEFILNEHGNEISYLSFIILHGEKDPKVAGYYQTNPDIPYNYYVSLNISSLFPETNSFHVGQIDTGVISILNCDDHTEVKDIARTLAHEYGHHYTLYYFDKLADEDWRESEYYKLRGLSKYDKVDLYTEDFDTYLEMHEWDISEIAAEDYVFFMGSPMTKSVKETMDIMEMLQYSLDNPNIDDIELWNNNYHWAGYFNIIPQENFFIPLPCEVKGLNAYFKSFIKGEGKANDDVFKIKKPVLTYKKVNSELYEFTWEPVKYDGVEMYTLVCYDEKNNILCAVKTSSDEKNLKAFVGKATIHKGTMYYYWADGLAEGTKHFKLYVSLKDGNMISSDVVTVKFK